MRIVCLEHASYEGPATIAEWAEERGHHFEIVRLYAEPFVHPGTPDMLVVMGGPMNVYDEAEHPYLAEEKRFIAQCADDGSAVLGVCLGAQLLSVALGGEVTRNPEPEIGWFPIELTAEGAQSPVLGVLPRRFVALQWHGDTFSVPPGAVHAARSVACENQAFEVDGGRILAMQFHLEPTPLSLEGLIAHHSDDLESPGAWVSSAAQMLADESRFATVRTLQFALLDAIVERWVASRRSQGWETPQGM